MKNIIFIAWGLLACLVLFTACTTNKSKEQQTTEAPTTETIKKSTEKLAAKSIAEGKKIRKRAFTKGEVIRAAEAFVLSQGYTDADIDWKANGIVFEESEYASDTADIIAARKGTLQPKAIAARPYGEGKWVVGFMPVNQENNIVRAITMDSIGTIMVMQTQGVREDWVRGLID